MAKIRFSDRFDQIHQIAMDATGLSDFGDTDYHGPFRRILEAVDEDLGDRFILGGAEAAMAYLSVALISRLHTEEGWKKYPAYKGVKITKPLIIVGMPRTGTTVLHKLLSVDPQFQSVPLWLFQRPTVRPPRDEWEANANYQRCVAAYKATFASDEDINKYHEMVLDEADECWWGLQQSFVTDTFYCGLGIASFAAWWNQQSERDTYRRYADLLRLIGLNDSRRWLLKNPYHTLHPHLVLETFPDACIVHTHRDPRKSIPSFANLLDLSQRSYVGDNRFPKRTGLIEANKWSQGILRTEYVRKHHPDRFYDVLQRDFLADPLKVVKGIYQYFELTLTEETESAMLQAVENHDQEKKKGSSHNPEYFGLSDDVLGELFAGYIGKYRL